MFTLALIFSVQAEEGMAYIPKTGDIPAYWIDLYEFPNQQGELPTRGLNLGQARMLCQSIGKELCTAAQWRRACLGKSGESRYGYGAIRKDGLCHLSPEQTISHSSLMSQDEVAVPAGSFQACKTEEGIFDMVGNVEEWVLDDWNGRGGSLEGGASYTSEIYADCTGRYSRMPDYRLTVEQNIFSAGARCCKNAGNEKLTQEHISLDHQKKMVEAKKSTSSDYQEGDEIEIASGLFMDRYEYPNQKGSMASNFVSWEEANQTCQKHSKRLCSVKEWEYACQGQEGYLFPYGDQHVKGACAIEQEERTPSGSNPACSSPKGVVDLTGGLWEWTSSPVNAKVLRGASGGSMYEIRGGAWMVEAVKATCRPNDGYPAASSKTLFESVGFRCCRGEHDFQPQMPWPPMVQCPENMVALGYFCIDRYEYPNQRGELPQGNKSLEQAKQLCQDQGKALCTEAQWSLACSGPSWRGYPYGNEYQSGYCAFSDERRPEGATQKSGQFERCATPEGIYDLSGNLWEWVQNEKDGGVLRGGGSYFSAGMGRCHSRAKLKGLRLTEAGFRCCWEPNSQD